MDPELNKEQGWLYTDAKYWATNSVEKHTAMYYLGLGGGKVTGGRFLAPNAEANEGTFYDQLAHKAYTTDEFFNLLVDAKKAFVNKDEDGDDISIDVMPRAIYGDGKAETVIGYVYTRVEAEKSKYFDDAKKLALVIAANGSAEGIEDADDLKAVAYEWFVPSNAYMEVETQSYYYNDGEGFTPVGPGSAIYVESKKDEYAIVDVEANAYKSGYYYKKGAHVTAFAEDTDYVLPGENEENEKENIVLASKDLTFLNAIANGTAYKPNSSVVNYSKEYYNGTKVVKNAAGAKLYDTFDAAYVRNDKGVDTIYDKASLYADAYDALSVKDAFNKVQDADTNSYEVCLSNILDYDTNKVTLQIATGADLTAKGTLVVRDNSAEADFVKDAKNNRYVAVEAGDEYNKNTAYFYVSKYDDEKDVITVSALGTTYDLNSTSLTQGVDLIKGHTYYYKNAKNAFVAISDDNLLTKAEIVGKDDDDTVFVAAEKVSTADYVKHPVYGYVSIDDLFEKGSKVDYKAEEDAADDPSKSYIKATSINIINIGDDEDDEKDDFRMSAVTPKTVDQNSEFVFNVFNEETATFIAIERYVGMSLDEAIAEFDANDMVVYSGVNASLEEAEDWDNFSDLTHKAGYYYLETPENDSDLYVLFTGRTSGLDLDFSVNQTKGEAYFELADGTTLTTKAVELTTDRKETTWFPAFETEEELCKAVYAITGLNKALEGTSEDKKETSFKKWYDAAKADLDAGLNKLPEGETLPTSGSTPVHNAEKCIYESTSDAVAVNVTADASKVDTKTAGIYDITYTADVAEGAENRTATVKVVVAPKYVRTWGANGKVKTLTSFYVSDEKAKYAFYEYDWDNNKVAVTYYNVDGSVATTAVNNIY